MLYFLIICAVIAALSVLCIWYITRNNTKIMDNSTLELDNDNNPLLIDWYQNILDKNRLDIINTNEELEIAQNILNKIYNTNVNLNNIIIGENIERYVQFGIKSIYNLRDRLGIDIDIAIVDSNLSYPPFVNDPDKLIILKAMLNTGLYETIFNYLQKVLDYRWQKLNSINSTNLINNSGSYAYFYTPSVPNVLHKETHNGYRVNLLCSDREFNNFIKRFSTITSISI